METKITFKCTGCGHKQSYEPPLEELPMCDKCFSPMAAVAASGFGKTK